MDGTPPRDRKSEATAIVKTANPIDLPIDALFRDNLELDVDYMTTRLGIAIRRIEEPAAPMLSIVKEAA